MTNCDSRKRIEAKFLSLEFKVQTILAYQVTCPAQAAPAKHMMHLHYPGSTCTVQGAPALSMMHLHSTGYTCAVQASGGERKQNDPRFRSIED